MYGIGASFGQKLFKLIKTEIRWGMRGKLCQIEPWFLDFERNSDVGTQTIILELALLIS